MNQHIFLFKPGYWLGEGKIILNMVEEELRFATNWLISTADFEGKISSVQQIEIDGISEKMKNELTFSHFSSNGFVAEMENLNIGKVEGKGVFDEKLIAWEFRGNILNFEGFETYRLQADGTYLMHAEYVTSDQFRTQIEGKIWLSSLEGPKKGTFS
jgi:hypothetical protein